MTAFEIDLTADAVRLRLNEAVTIEHARLLHSALATALLLPRGLVIDPTALARIDAAGLQVLLAAARAASRAELSAPSAVWTSALQLHGLTDPFIQP